MNASQHIQNDGPQQTACVIQTSRRGDCQAEKCKLVFETGQAVGTVIDIRPEQVRHTLLGIGTSFSESAAFVLAHLDPAQRRAVMRRAFSSAGANFSIARTHIGACDFCVEGRYSYADGGEDTTLSGFSVEVDRDGFDRDRYPGIRDEQYDLLPMILEAQQIKHSQTDHDLRLIASAWTAPPWMKDTAAWYTPGRADNDHVGGGGSLKPEQHATYADYLTRFLAAYRDAGVEIWAITPVNEPLGNNGQWESMHFCAEGQRDFIRDHLGPRLRATGNGEVKLLIYDHNRKDLAHWADVIYGDPRCRDFTYGAAVHWYDSTYKVYEDVLQSVRDKYPDQAIIHTEGCIDDLGNTAPAHGIADPEGFRESNWFDNDEFWWNDNATDWAYTANWPGVEPDDHPRYAPVHRYARDILVSLDHGVEAWVDWNMVLDRRGGPNHVGNYCGAPIMVDTASGHVHYTPVFHILAQLSRTIRPGDAVVHSGITSAERCPDGLYCLATINRQREVSVQILNISASERLYSLQIGPQHARGSIEAGALQTLRVALT